MEQHEQYQAKTSRSGLSRVSHIVRGFTTGPTRPQSLRRTGLGRRGTTSGLPMSSEEVQHFVYDGLITWFGSSTVTSAQYFIYVEKLLVEFRTGGMYLYSSITEHEAFDFLSVKSKGSYIWDHFRVRGKGGGKISKKSFIKIR